MRLPDNEVAIAEIVAPAMYDYDSWVSRTKACGVSRNTFSRWRRKVKPNESILPKLASALAARRRELAKQVDNLDDIAAALDKLLKARR